MRLDQFREIWLIDFEFQAASGERPVPLCFSAHEWRSGRTIRQWLIDSPPAAPPYNIGPDAMIVGYYASAELGCHLALNWPMPVHVLDLYAEFRLKTSGLPVPAGYGLLGALSYFGLGGIASADKDAMRALAIRGGPYDEGERRALLDYCASDTDGLCRLLSAMARELDVSRALLRGRYMAAAARIESQGVPIDENALAALRANWTNIQDELVTSIDAERGIWEGRSFRSENFAAWLIKKGIPWPRLESGSLDLSEQCFREMTRCFPADVGPIRELRNALSQLRLESLAVGRDSRNRCLLSAFSSRSSRNQPSNSKFIFGPSTWLRSLIKPAEGRAVAYVDYCQQEFGIAARLSSDQAMQKAYRSGDPYLTFGQQAGAIPPNATAVSHRAEREQFKILSLAVQYGMQAESLARRLNTIPAQGRVLIGLHKRTYPDYWRWSDAAEMHGMLYGELTTVFGWKVHVGPNVNPRSLRNFPSQANGAEMLRLACILATESGISVCAPIHDALLIESSLELIKHDVAQTQDCMARASEMILPGFQLRTDAKVVRYPDRYSDPRGRQFWQTVWRLVEGGCSRGCITDDRQPITNDTPALLINILT